MNGSYGLGLSIAESHKEKIWAENENGNKTIFVQLPTNNGIEKRWDFSQPQFVLSVQIGAAHSYGGTGIFYARDGTRKAVRKTCRWQVFGPWKSP